MNYEHTQHAPLHLILYFVAIFQLALAWVLRNEAWVPLLLVGLGVLTFLFALMFKHLTIRDEGEHLAIRYGPLRVFRKTIPYSSITSVEPARTSVIDGWGIHYVIGRGWTYNLWGFDCVKLIVDGKVFRIGSDDVAALVDFLRHKIRGA